MTADHYDVDAILETMRRRERALQTAGSHQSKFNGPRWDGPRPDAQPSADRPILVWPDQRRDIPRSCWNCGAGSANYEVRAPYGLVKTGEVNCLVCSRVVVRLRALAPRVALEPKPEPEIVRPGRPYLGPVLPDGRRACRACLTEPRSEKNPLCWRCHHKHYRQGRAR